MARAWSGKWLVALTSTMAFTRFGLHGGHVQQNVAPAAYTQPFENSDTEAVEQRQDITGSGIVAEFRHRVDRAAMAAHIRHNQLEIACPLCG